MSKSKKEKILLGILIFLFTGGSIFFLFSKEKKSWGVEGAGESLKKIEIEPIKKSLFSGLPCENADIRAFGVVIAEYPETMPLSSPFEADIVIEAPTNTSGGLTRLLAIYQCQDPKEIGSIRSVRPYMADLALGFDLVFSSWGGCDLAVSRIRNIGLDWLDARVNPSGAFFRKRNIPAPHNGFSSLEKLKVAAGSLGMRKENKFEGYKFMEENEITLLNEEQVIDINYYYPVKYVYDRETGNYLRFWNGNEMIDRNTSKQVFAKNVVLMKTKIGVLSSGVADIKVIGEGEAKIYQAGKEINGIWKKENSKGKLSFFDENGEEIKFVPGPIWIEIID